MTVLENIELCDNGYTESQEVHSSQKIKLRNPSYTTILSKYIAFKNESTQLESETVPVNPIVETSAEVVRVVAINPIVGSIHILEVHGQLKSDGNKALKIKPSMYECIKKNSASEKEDVVTNESEPVELNNSSISSEIINDEIQTNQMAENIEVAEPVDSFKVSRNEAAIAKVEKYAAVANSMEIAYDKGASEEIVEQASNETVISPTVIEEENARPVSREIPLVAPERPVADEDVAVKDEITHTENMEFALDGITNLEQIREYLTRIAELKKVAEQARDKETAARESAERAEKETADSRDEFRKTAERIAAHQETLIAEAQRSNAQASIYEARREELEAEKAEYNQAINDMLAVMGDQNEGKKEKPM